MSNLVARCSLKGCEQPARWLVGLRMWARGFPKATTPPLEATIGLTVCLLHGPLTTLADVLSEPGKKQIEAGCASVGRALPDWETAEVVLRPVDVDLIKRMSR